MNQYSELRAILSSTPSVIQQNTRRAIDNYGCNCPTDQTYKETSGRELWSIIHKMMFRIVYVFYQEKRPTYWLLERVKTFKSFVQSLILLHPCTMCGDNWMMTLTNAPFPDIVNDTDPIDYMLWTWHIHNNVNVALGKPEFSIESFAKWTQCTIDSIEMSASDWKATTNRN